MKCIGYMKLGDDMHPLALTFFCWTRESHRCHTNAGRSEASGVKAGYSHFLSTVLFGCDTLLASVDSSVVIPTSVVSSLPVNSLAKPGLEFT